MRVDRVLWAALESFNGREVRRDGEEGTWADDRTESRSGRGADPTCGGNWIGFGSTTPMDADGQAISRGLGCWLDDWFAGGADSMWLVPRGRSMAAFLDRG